MLIEHIEHLEEAAAGGDVVEVVVLELPFGSGAALAPNAQVYAYSLFHNCVLCDVGVRLGLIVAGLHVYCLVL